MEGQISFDMLPCMNTIRKAFGMCTGCICKQCLYYASGRCPHGRCYDDLRAKVYPYNTVYPDDIRTEWSNWNLPGEQAHWCRGGDFYQARCCTEFVQYTGCQVEDCLSAMVTKYQDGYMLCALIDCLGCEKCMERWEQRQEANEWND